MFEINFSPLNQHVGKLFVQRFPHLSRTLSIHIQVAMGITYTYNLQLSSSLRASKISSMKYLIRLISNLYNKIWLEHVPSLVKRFHISKRNMSGCHVCHTFFWFTIGKKKQPRTIGTSTRLGPNFVWGNSCPTLLAFVTFPPLRGPLL